VSAAGEFIFPRSRADEASVQLRKISNRRPPNVDWNNRSIGLKNRQLELGNRKLRLFAWETP